MTRDEVLERFASLNVWRRGGERAPHKPLLLLLTLARVARGGARLVPFADVEEPPRTLLVEFGPPRKTQNPHLPYWHLQSDGEEQRYLLIGRSSFGRVLVVVHTERGRRIRLISARPANAHEKRAYEQGH